MAKVFPNLTALKQLSFTYQTPYENLQATPTALPTTEPATPQISYTVALADLPTISQNVESKIYVACIYTGGKNTDTGARTIYWRMLKNGAGFSAGSFSVGANYFWTLCSFFSNVAVGDVLELRIWSNSNLVNWDYEARQIQFSRVALHEKDFLWLYQVKTLSPQPTLTLGNPYSITGYLLVHHKSGANIFMTGATDFSSWKQHPMYKLFRIYYGDYTGYNNSLGRTATTYRPNYYRNYVPGLIHIRALKNLL